MRTRFSDIQLADPALSAAEHELRKCVHCGICTATCPTYTLLGDELDGPRGRIQLIQGMLESGAAPSPTVVMHVDRCLSCLACVSACPSGVSYPRLIDEARAHVERTFRRPRYEAFIRRALGFVLPRRWLFRWALTVGRYASDIAALVPLPLGSLIDAAKKLPPVQRRRELAKRYPAQGQRRLRLALHAGCVQEVIAPAITASAVRVLTRFGAEVVLVEGDGCCGALNHHLGQTQVFEGHALRLAQDVAAHAADCEAIVTTTSGCGAVMRDYAFALHAEEGKAVGERVRDISDVLAELPLERVDALPKLRVGYHAACSLAHGMQRGVDIPEVLTRLGFEVVTPSDTNCCGSAGVYNVLQPEIAHALQERKGEAVNALDADVIVTGNIGCLTQIGAVSNAPVVHIVELVDWATGGPTPQALRGRISA
ncbi:MAG: glycolate oxidase subunit GlcF [Alphaproteobacteria bacterium]|nr:glycolate oxidase subunit GlcF [Alphaproteobacteria bacterium]